MNRGRMCGSSVDICTSQLTSLRLVVLSETQDLSTGLTQMSWPAAPQSTAGQVNVDINCLFLEHSHRKSLKSWPADALRLSSCIVYAFTYRDKYFRGAGRRARLAHWSLE